jgi:hypothetical protein
MHLTMRVPGERQDPPGTRQGRLRADLGGDLARTDAAAEEAFGELGEPQKPALAVHEAPDHCRIAHRPAADKIDVQTNLQVRLHPGLRSRLGGRVGSHEERRRADDAAAVRIKDPFRDAGREAEVVRGHDERHLP